jgi:type I restriction enzyme, S subunit
MSDDFPIESLGGLVTVQGGFAFSSDDFRDYGVPVLKIKNIRPRYVDASEVDYVDDEVAQAASRYVCETGDILISMTGSGPQAPNSVVGRVARFTGRSGEFLINQRVGRFLVKDRRKLDPRFLFFVLTLPDYQSELVSTSTGSANQANISRQQIESLKIPVPPICVQKHIASLLGALDDKIELNRRMNETLEAMARAIFKDWFVHFGPTRAKMEGRAPYLIAELWKLFPDRLDDEDKAAGWELRPISSFATIKGGKQLSKEKITGHGPIPVFGGAGLMGYTGAYNADGYVISVGRVGAYCGQFFAHRGKVWINNNASLIRQNESVPGEWLLLALQGLDIDLIKRGAAQPFVSNSDLLEMKVVYPGERVLAAFQNTISDLVRRRELNDRESSTLAQTRDLLLPKLMSGEIRLREAEKLVERVA